MEHNWLTHKFHFSTLRLQKSWSKWLLSVIENGYLCLAQMHASKDWIMNDIHKLKYFGFAAVVDYACSYVDHGWYIYVYIIKLI